MNNYKRFIQGLALPLEKKNLFFEDLAVTVKNLLPTTRHFVLHQDLLLPMCTIGFPEDVTISLPFKTCWFEFLNSSGGEPWGLALTEDIKVSGWLVHERGPNDFLLSFLQLHPGKGFQVETINELIKVPRLHAQVLMINTMLRKSVSFGAESSNESFKVKVNGENKFHKIKKIVHVWPKKLVDKKVGLPQNIDWSHRWLVMGHWRKINDDCLGKDREGNYSIQGKTWVVDHKKGPEHLPLVADKVRLVHRNIEGVL